MPPTLSLPVPATDRAIVDSPNRFMDKPYVAETAFEAASGLLLHMVDELYYRLSSRSANSLFSLNSSQSSPIILLI